MYRVGLQMPRAESFASGAVRELPVRGGAAAQLPACGGLERCHVPGHGVGSPGFRLLLRCACHPQWRGRRLWTPFRAGRRHSWSHRAMGERLSGGDLLRPERARSGRGFRVWKRGGGSDPLAATGHAKRLRSTLARAPARHAGFAPGLSSGWDQALGRGLGLRLLPLQPGRLRGIDGAGRRLDNGGPASSLSRARLACGGALRLARRIIQGLH
mmetsp:Transcript_94271/g.224464  ORF Transcript_94271/g.224464 Transcript_94271/m.224464 type:complete len:213 (-) Transcript_94271:326-964(-)